MRFDDKRPLRVMVVDDSRTIRRMIALKLQDDARLRVVGEAADPFEAREKIKELLPDVLTLDVEMPGMDGLEFLSRLMRLRPMPVVMVSTLTREGSSAAVRALSLGAVDCVDKRHILHPEEASRSLAETLLMAGTARLRPQTAVQTPAGAVSDFRWGGRFVVIGSSTGGVDALTTVLSGLPENAPPVVIAQHMPAPFLESFTERLDGTVRPRVRPAEHGTELRQGEVLVAPGGDRHVILTGGATTRVSLVPDEGAAYVPLIDKLFHAAAGFGARGVGVILTGMGRDGAEGLLAMRAAGAHTIAEAAETAVIDGMPRAAREIGAAIEVRPIDRIAPAILDATARRARVENRAGARP